MFDDALPIQYNPIIEIQNALRLKPTYNFIANAYAEYNFTKALTLKITGGYTRNTNEAQAFYNSKTYYGADTIPGRATVGNGVSGSIYNNYYNTWVNENTLNYKKTFAGSHQLNVLVGASFQKMQSAIRGFSVTHIPKDDETLGLDALGYAPALWSSTGASYSATASSSRWTMASFFGRLNYDYKGRYLLTATLRDDGSSKFAPGHKWGIFPSVAGAWRLSDEVFMKKISTVSDAKIRLSYGKTGNNRVGDFDYLPILGFASGTNPVGYTYNNQAGGSGAAISSIGNADLKWETTAQTNAGLDLGFFQQRILFTFDWYRKVTDDLLLRANVPTTLGVSTAIVNIGKMQNTGLEFSLTTSNIDQKNFKWVSAFNISFNRNKLLALTKGATYLTNQGGVLGRNNSYNTLPAYISKLGQPLGQLYGEVFDGIYQYSDFNKMPNGTYTLKPGIPYYISPSTPQPGWAKYKDINGDGVVDGSDYTVIGRGQPIHTGGFSNNITYKNFDLNIFFQWSYGNNLINANRIVFEAPGENYPTGINLMATMANAWSPTNQTSNIPTGAGTNYLAYNSRVVEDGSYLRLKTVQLGYTLPRTLLKRIKMSTLRLYVTAQNIFTWTKYSGPDPEVSTLNSVLTPGFDYMAYPMPKTIVFGLNASF